MARRYKNPRMQREVLRRRLNSPSVNIVFTLYLKRVIEIESLLFTTSLKLILRFKSPAFRITKYLFTFYLNVPAQYPGLYPPAGWRPPARLAGGVSVGWGGGGVPLPLPPCSPCRVSRLRAGGKPCGAGEGAPTAKGWGRVRAHPFEDWRCGTVLRVPHIFSHFPFSYSHEVNTKNAIRQNTVVV